MASTARDLAALLLFAAILFLTNVWGYDLWPADEPRFGQVAREMLQSGDWLVLRVNGQPYTEKPPLLFWVIALFSLPFGDVTEFTARLPSVVAASVTMALTYLLARRLYGRRTAWWAALVLMTGTRFWWEARTARTDMLLTACLTAALWFFWCWHEERRARWLLGFYGAITAAVYAKGPPGLVFPVLLIAAFYWKQKEPRRRLHLGWGLLVAAALVCLWLVPSRRTISTATHHEVSNLGANLFRHTIGRFFLGVSKAQGPWYYFLELPVDLLPWSLFLPWIIPWVWRRRREGPGMRLLLSWVVPAFVFFTICTGKRATYLLPLYPAFAILLARSALDLMDSQCARWRKRTACVWGVCLILLGFGAWALLFTAYAEYVSFGVVLFGGCAVGLGAGTVFLAARRDARWLPTAMIVHFAVLGVLCATLIFPVMNRFKSARSLCEPVRRLREHHVEYRLYSLGFSREEYVFYAKHFHEPRFIEGMAIDVPLGVEPAHVASVQRHFRQAIADAVATVPIISLDSVTDSELQALQTRVADVASTVGEERALIDRINEAMKNSLQEFAAEFEEPSPAFLFVQEDDWRWMLAFHPPLRKHHIIRHQRVGRRTVLLIANAEGAMNTSKI